MYENIKYAHQVKFQPKIKLKFVGHNPREFPSYGYEIAGVFGPP